MFYTLFIKKITGFAVGSILFLFGMTGCVVSPQRISPTPAPTFTQTVIPATLTPPSTIQAQSPSPSPCKETSSVIENAIFQSLILGKQENVRVYLPACYDPSRENGYPVLYLLHGQSSTVDQWQGFGAVTEADSLIAGKQRLPFIMVMPYEENSLQPTKQSRFGELVIKELIPWVDQTYHTCAQQSCRAITGISRGAAWAIHEGLSNPHLFESVAAHSLPPFDADVKQVAEWLSGIPLPDIPRIWMDAGRGDLFLPQARIFEEALTLNGIPHEFYIYAGYHDEGYWKSHMAEYIEWSTFAWK